MFRVYVLYLKDKNNLREAGKPIFASHDEALVKRESKRYIMMNHGNTDVVDISILDLNDISHPSF